MIQELESKRAELRERADNASGEERADALEALVALEERIGDLRDQESRARAATKYMTGLAGPRGPRSNELRGFIDGSGPSALSFRVESRDLVAGTSAAGGATVPTRFHGRLAQHMVDVSALLGAGVTRIRTDGGEALQIPKTTAHSTAGIVNEAAVIPESDPTFGQVTLGAYKYGVLVQVSHELLKDTGVDLEGYLALQAGRALGNALGADLINGAGSDQPRGLLLDAAAGVVGPDGAGGGFGDLGADLLMDLVHSVISPYRASQSCGWIMNDATSAAVQKLKDGNGQYLWQRSLTAGQPATLLGFPVTIDPFMPDMAPDASPIAFGDLSAYYVRLAGDVRFERSDEFAYSRDLVTFRALLRADGALVDTSGAVKTFVGGAA